jgi:matrixin
MKYAIAIVALLLGCSAPVKTQIVQRPIAAREAFPPIFKHVCVDTAAFDAEDTEQLVSALAEWRTALNGAFDFELGGLCDWTVFSIEEANEQAPSLDILAYTNMVGGNLIFVFRHRIHSEQKLKAVLLHEAGHLLGADHNPHKQGLMSDTYTVLDYASIDAWSIDQVVRYQQSTTIYQGIQQ